MKTPPITEEDLGSEVWFIYKDKVRKAILQVIETSFGINLNNNQVYKSATYTVFSNEKFGENHNHRVSEVFKTKSELLESL